MAIVSRLELNHPALGNQGGAALHTSIEALYKKIGDSVNSRYFEITALDDAATITIDHNFKVAFEEIGVLLYSWDPVSGELTRINAASTPALSSFDIAATTGNLTTETDITNNSGAAQDLVAIVIHGSAGGTSTGQGEQNFIDVNTFSFTDSANVTSTETQVETEILGESKTFKIDVTASATVSDKTSIPFSIPRKASGFQDQLLRLKFLLEAGTNFADSDMEVVVVHDPSGTPTDVSSQNIKDLEPSKTGVFETPFVADSDNTKLDYALEFRVKTASKAFDFFVGELKVDEGNTGRGSLKGWKTYDDSVVNITVTNGTLNTIHRANFKPYKDPINGVWRMTFNINGVLGSADSSYVLHLSGVKFKNKTFFFQAVTLSSEQGDEVAKAYANPNSDAIVANTEADQGGFRMFGDVELDEKPTWADFEPEFNQLDEAALYENSQLRVSLNADISLPDNTSKNLHFQVLDSIQSKGIDYNSSNGVLKVKASGSYEITLNCYLDTVWNDTGVYFYFREALNGVPNSGSIMAKQIPDTSAQLFNMTSMVYLKKGKSYHFGCRNDSGASQTIKLHSNNISEFIVKKIPERSTQAPYNFAIAKNGNYGLIDISEDTITLDNSITGSIQLYKIGKQVTVTFLSISSYSDATSIGTSVGLIPLKYRPTIDIASVSSFNNSYLVKTVLTSDGKVEFLHRSFSGTNSLQSNPLNASSITYITSN